MSGVIVRDDISAYRRRLIRKQKRVLEYLAAGLSTEEIAARERTTATSVLGCIDRMRAEYGARNRAQLVHIAWQRGLLNDK